MQTCAQRIFEKYPAGCIFAHYSWEINLRAGVYWYLYANFSATEPAHSRRGYFRDDISTPISSKLLSGTSLSHRKKWVLSTIREREVRTLSITKPPCDSSEIGDRLSQLSSVTTRALFFLFDLRVCPFTWTYFLLKVTIAICSIIKSISYKLNQTGTISFSAWTIHRDGSQDLIIFLVSSAKYLIILFNNTFAP